MAQLAGAPATVAYFSMEIALDDAVPTYSGGLGVLAGDHLRAAADLGVPMVGVTLLYHHGYFDQRLGADGSQREEPVQWSPSDVLERMPGAATVHVQGADVHVGAWRAVVRGVTGHEVPVFLLDTDLAENTQAYRDVCNSLYGGDDEYRLRQEIVLGLGGVALLERAGVEPATFHMNEGHSALLGLALSRRARRAGRRDVVAAVRERCVFTTHTPVPAGHDRFPAAMVEELLGADAVADLRALHAIDEDCLDMTRLGMGSSRVVNAVSRRHGEVTRAMFPGVTVRSVTNGVHAPFWAAPPVARLFDDNVPGWREDPALLRQMLAVALEEVRSAHESCKQALVEALEARAGVRLDPKALLVGAARRATPYKRMGLLFTDPDRLRSMARSAGPVQVVLSGKAHPRDEAGKDLIRHVHAVAKTLGADVPVVYVPGHSMELNRLLCSGSDIWLNTPRKPHEASGTSGMKAAVNGVLSLSVLDGWWVEGHVEGVTGWAVGDLQAESADDEDAAALYRALEHAVLPLYYDDPDGFTAVRRATMALNGSYFTTERMVAEYCRVAYRSGPPAAED